MRPARNVTTVVILILMISVLFGTDPASAKGAPLQFKSQCLRYAHAPMSIPPLPKPEYLTRQFTLTWNGTITLGPVSSRTVPAISARKLWHTMAPQPSKATRQLFLAYVSSTVPAVQQPDGTLQPLAQHVLAWVLLSQREPFDFGTVSGLNRSTASSSCRYIGQSLDAWSATTGQQVLSNSGYLRGFSMVHVDLASRSDR